MDQSSPVCVEEEIYCVARRSKNGRLMLSELKAPSLRLRGLNASRTKEDQYDRARSDLPVKIERLMFLADVCCVLSVR